MIQRDNRKCKPTKFWVYSLVIGLLLASGQILILWTCNPLAILEIVVTYSLLSIALLSSQKWITRLRTWLMLLILAQLVYMLNVFILDKYGALEVESYVLGLATIVTLPVFFSYVSVIVWIAYSLLTRNPKFLSMPTSKLSVDDTTTIKNRMTKPLSRIEFSDKWLWFLRIVISGYMGAFQVLVLNWEQQPAIWTIAPYLIFCTLCLPNRNKLKQRYTWVLLWGGSGTIYTLNILLMALIFYDNQHGIYGNSGMSFLLFPLYVIYTGILCFGRVVWLHDHRKH